MASCQRLTTAHQYASYRDIRIGFYSYSAASAAALLLLHSFLLDLWKAKPAVNVTVTYCSLTVGVETSSVEPAPDGITGEQG